LTRWHYGLTLLDFDAGGQAAARHAGKQRQAGNAGIAAGFWALDQ
jgi:hypothetical protein